LLRASLESLAASLQPQHSRLEAPNPWQQAAAPQLGSCASSGRAWRLQAARHSSQGGRGAGRPTGRPATASAARARRLQSRRSHLEVAAFAAFRHGLLLLAQPPHHVGAPQDDALQAALRAAPRLRAVTLPAPDGDGGLVTLVHAVDAEV